MPSPATLVALSDAKDQLRIRHDESDPEIQAMLADAEDVVLRIVGDLADDDWDESTVPGPVRAAILRQLTAMWSGRGDEAQLLIDDTGLAKGVFAILVAGGYRDLTIA